MKKILIIVGTRPEAVKLCPLILELNRHGSFITEICSTGQHKEILNETFNAFQIHPTYHLDILKPNATLSELTSRCLQETNTLFSQVKPDLIIVQGDTTTAFAAGLSAFYNKIPVAHIEAGLRTNEKYLPFPEEMNRSLLSRIATFHFAPTELSKNNLTKEGITENVWVTGNTVIDAVNITLKSLTARYKETEIIKQLEGYGIYLNYDLPFILATCHRRENMTNHILNNIGHALNNISETTPIILTKHPNPNMSYLYTLLKDNKNIILIDPPSHPLFLWLLSKAALIISDSGGVQEESSSFQKNILILRESTERPEIVNCGLGILVGDNAQLIIETAKKILNSPSEKKENCFPFGDGSSCEKITNILFEKLS